VIDELVKEQFVDVLPEVGSRRGNPSPVRMLVNWLRITDKMNL